MSGDGTRDLLKRLIDAVRSGEYPHEEKPAEPIDWSNYDKAQINEVNDMLLEIRNTVDRVWPRLAPNEEDPPNGPGRPPTPPPNVAKALLVQQYFQASNRQAEGLVLLFQEKLGIEEGFSYKTIERGYDNETVVRIVEQAFHDAADSVAHAETGIAIDGTGLPTSLKVNYETAKRKGRQRDWEYMVSGFGQDTGMMLGQELLASPHGMAARIPSAQQGGERVLGVRAHLPHTASATDQRTPGWGGKGARVRVQPAAQGVPLLLD